jgi:hypothetical protein
MAIQWCDRKVSVKQNFIQMIIEPHRHGSIEDTLIGQRRGDVPFGENLVE